MKVGSMSTYSSSSHARPRVTLPRSAAARSGSAQVRCMSALIAASLVLPPSSSWAIAPAAPMSAVDCFQRGQQLEKSGDLDGAARAYIEAYEMIREGEGSHSRKAQALARYVVVQQRLASSLEERHRLQQALDVVIQYLRLLRATYAGDAPSVRGYSVATRLVADLERELSTTAPQEPEGTRPAPPPPPQPSSALIPAPREAASLAEHDRQIPPTGRRLVLAGGAALSLGVLSNVGFGVSLGLGNRASERYLAGPSRLDRDTATDRGRAANASAVVFGTLAGVLLVAGMTLVLVACCRKRSTSTAMACVDRGGARRARCRGTML